MKVKATVTLTLMLIAVLSASGLFFVDANFTPLPELPPPIYIRADGTVDPPEAPIHRVDSTYTLTSDINNTIEIQCPNIVLDGDGFTVTKPSVSTLGLMMPIGWLPGVHIESLSNVKVTNVVFDGCITGVAVENGTEVSISQNIMRNCESCIVVMSSSDVAIVGNSMTAFGVGINLLPLNPDSSNPLRIRIEGNQIVGDGEQAPAAPAPQPNQYGIWGTFSDSKVSANNFSNIEGIGLYNLASNNLIADNNFQNNYEGILVNTNQEIFFGNVFCGNNFDHNSVNVVIPYIRNYSPDSNRWDNGSVGNYWSDYSGSDSNGDGVGDTPYLLQTVYTNYEQQTNVTVEEGQDNYPAMVPFSISIPAGAQATPTSAPAQEPEALPIQTVAVVVLVTVTAIAVVGVAVYLKRHHQPPKSAVSMAFFHGSRNLV